MRFTFSEPQITDALSERARTYCLTLATISHTRFDPKMKQDPIDPPNRFVRSNTISSKSVSTLSSELCSYPLYRVSLAASFGIGWPPQYTRHTHTSADFCSEETKCHFDRVLGRNLRATVERKLNRTWLERRHKQIDVFFTQSPLRKRW